MSRLLICLLTALVPLGATAADIKATAAAAAAKNAPPPGTSEYSLLSKVVKFYAPSEWIVMLEKKEGMPQFIAFQVKDPADQGSGEASQVSVETKVLNDASTYDALVNAGTDKAKQSPGFELHGDGVDPGVLRYYALNGKQRYEYREVWYQDLKIFIHVRCARPLLGATSANWTSAYNAGCAEVMQSIKPH